jgi:hypothetical protein
MSDPRADGDITVVSISTGFLIGRTRRRQDAPAVTQYVRLASEIGEAKRLAEAMAMRSGNRTWISRERGFSTFL